MKRYALRLAGLAVLAYVIEKAIIHGFLPGAI